MLRCNAMYNLSKCIGIEIQKDVADMLDETIAINNLANVEVINDDFKNVYIKNDSIDNIIVNPPYQKMATVFLTRILIFTHRDTIMR